MKAVALFSGGVDSTVMLWKLRSDGIDVSVVSFNYYRRNSREIEACRRILGLIPHEESVEIEMPFLREFSDLPPSVQTDLTVRLGNPEPVFIPFRNIIFYSAAAHIATQLRASIIVGGHTLEDQANLPDASGGYIEKLNSILGASVDNKLRIVAPLHELRKTDVVRLGMTLGAPLHLTWSCWAVGDEHCGVCPGCMSRKRAFEAAGYADPTTYLERYVPI